ncbi:DUF2878 domain-containing protein [Vibrio maerlii]|uniref:DUF2878 domain-containing protein n=1 Tax=Vibrio maerlii TaxID=2231648 RepID=UPI000E3B5BAD|nr:DUF2878 domain-containing protein [Vibrio maerlii]
MRLVAISVWFQLLWFLAVLGQSHYQVWLFALVVASYVWLMTLGKHFLSQAVAFSVVGVLVDSLNQAGGLFIFPSHFIPLWLVALWFAFGWYANLMAARLSTLPHLVVIALGAMGGALSYFAGVKFGAVEWGIPFMTTFIILMIEWALLTSLILFASKKEWFSNQYVNN